VVAKYDERRKRKDMGMDKSVIWALILAVVTTSVGCSGPSAEVIAEANSAEREFLLGPEDVIDIAVWRSEDLTQKDVVIGPDGKISMPLIGEVEVTGRTAEGLAAQIVGRLKEFKENPSVSVKVKEVNSYHVYVLGEVVRPGKYPLKSYATVLQAVALAGGFTMYAAKNNMQVLRTVTEGGQAKKFKIPARYDELVSGDGKIKDFVLKTGDVVVVPSRVW
jgi:polysaccharide biosynthesis/export protein